ncbi:Eco57I restriction-modification methylase domain-containing protein [Patescibacteria group bacterium]|nr:Eco57I restriction-modification methylase domain-containing protein [Patescibacteria group bacterium]
MSKKQLGQFFTTNSDYILQGLKKYIKDKEVTDPFAGGGDLINWAKRSGAKSARGYDIDKQYINDCQIFYGDSINNPQKYKFVLTNPPYLHKNKADKETKEKYFCKEFEDLYQISLNSIMNSEEGIVIVPINFLSAENSKKIRNTFFSEFKIVKMNYFKQQVFPDTTYNVIAFYYKKKSKAEADSFVIKTHIFPEKKTIQIKLHKNFDWTIGGEVLGAIKNQKNILGVYRLTKNETLGEDAKIEIEVAFNHIKNREKIKVSKNFHDLIQSNIILLKAIDSGTQKGKIALENIKGYDLECLISKPSSRNMVYLIFRDPISVDEQEKLIKLFNKELNKLRDDYLSLFLTNFRDNDRKRLSFDFAYKFLNYLYFNQLNKRQEVMQF